MISKDTLVLSKTWQEQDYPRDTLRHSYPDKLYVFTLAELTTLGLSFGVGSSAEAAKECCLTASKQRPHAPNSGPSQGPATLLSELATARYSTEQSLRWLQSAKGIYAGLPWFHQVWSRDELIAALGYTKPEQIDLVEQYLGYQLLEGELPTYLGSGTTCADGLGWLCLLINEIGLEHFKPETYKRLIHFLEEAHVQLGHHRKASHGFIHSGHNATWMDTIGRQGFRLEIQCMYALLLELLFAITEKVEYHREYLAFSGKIKQHFFRDGYLWDGLDDPTKRPNVFLAYLLQPSLLNQNSWQSCFDHIIQCTRSPWGGLSSIDMQNPAFYPHSTGEDNRSYHNGDSWFFINNLAGIALHRFNQRRYGKVIVELLQSSTAEILWQNMVGCPGEISSAAALESFGCGIQAFSGGTYLAFLNEAELYSAKQERDSINFFWDSTADSTSESFLR